MHSWLRLTVVTVVSAVGIGLVTVSVLGGPGPLPEVGAPVLMEAASDEDLNADHDERSDPEGGIVHPDPVEEARDRRAAAERRADRRQARAALLEARAERREAREGRGPSPSDPPPVDDERGRDGQDENSQGDDSAEDGDDDGGDDGGRGENGGNDDGGRGDDGGDDDGDDDD